MANFSVCWGRNISSAATYDIMVKRLREGGQSIKMLSYFFNMPHYGWTWRKFLLSLGGYTTLNSSLFSGGNFFRLKEFNNVSFTDSDEEQTY